MTIIIGIDPGQTTGICIVQTDKEPVGGFHILVADDYEWEDRFGLAGLIKKSIKALSTVVIESFNLYPVAAKGQAAIRSSFPSVEMIGIVSYACHINEIELVRQPPSVRSRVTVLPEHKEALRGLHHAVDAYKHVRYYLVHQAHLNKQPQHNT